MMQHMLADIGWGDAGEIFLRLLLAATAGGLVGLEREIRGREAGFRTNLLVCLGSCLTMLVSLRFGVHQWTPQQPGVNINVDPGRIAYGVMTGVGFLGAGAIIRHQGNVRGLTTAAAMWCVAAMGLAAGFGMYVVTGIATLLVVGALWLLGYVEDRLPKVRHRTVTVRRDWGEGCLESTVAYFKSQGLVVTDVWFHRTPDLTHADISVLIGFAHIEQYYACARELERSPEYQFLSVSEA